MMKTKIIVLLAALMWVNGLFAQAESWPKDTVDGVVVYRYTVQKSEGLYRISKNFNVSQEELVRLNPTLQTEGLKFGQVILVPVKEEQPATTAESSYVKHVIEPKETLYAISKRYGVSVAELQAANPEVSKNMPIGATLLIPVRAAEGATLPVPQTQAEAPKMDAPQPQLEAPKVETPKAEVETPTIEASKAEEVVLPAPKLQVDSLTAVQQVATDSMVEHPLLLPYDSSIISALPLRIAYLLPFQVEAAKRDGQMDRFIDFYEGALLAIYEAQACGQHFEIFTYDVQKSDIAIQKVLKKGEMQNLDAIIGPAYPAQVSHAALFAKWHIFSFSFFISGR